MSLYYFICGNKPLKEQGNPYLKMLSVNEALNMGIDVDVSVFPEGFDLNTPEVILYVEKEEDLYYPNIFSVDRRAYEEIQSECEHMVELEWNYDKKQIPVVLKYIQEQLLENDVVEVWKVWLSNQLLHKRLHKEEISIKELNEEELYHFFEKADDYSCLIIKK